MRAEVENDILDFIFTAMYDKAATIQRCSACKDGARMGSFLYAERMSTLNSRGLCVLLACCKQNDC